MRTRAPGTVNDRVHKARAGSSPVRPGSRPTAGSGAEPPRGATTAGRRRERPGSRSPRGQRQASPTPAPGGSGHRSRRRGGPAVVIGPGRAPRGVTGPGRTGPPPGVGPVRQVRGSRPGSPPGRRRCGPAPSGHGPPPPGAPSTSSGCGPAAADAGRDAHAAQGRPRPSRAPDGPLGHGPPGSGGRPGTGGGPRSTGSTQRVGGAPRMLEQPRQLPKPEAAARRHRGRLAGRRRPTDRHPHQLLAGPGQVRPLASESRCSR